MIFPLENNPRVTSYHGEPTGMGRFGKHLGIDRAVSYKPFFAPADGIVKAKGSGGSGGLWVEVLIGKYLWRFLHLSRLYCSIGEKVSEGEMLGITGNSGITTGAHLHYDARIAGTNWYDSFSNYVNPDELIRKSQRPKLPHIGAVIQLLPTDTRTTFKAGSVVKAGTIKVTDNTFLYKVRGYDPKYPNRVLINSRSAGGDGVALALYYTNNTKIEGWRVV